MSTSHLERLVVEIRQLRVAGNHYSLSLREKILEHSNRLHEEGWSWASIAKHLGLSATSIHRWRREREENLTFLPVLIQEEPELQEEIPEAQSQKNHTLVLHSKNGFHLEGLTLEQAIYAMERLACLA